MFVKIIESGDDENFIRRGESAVTVLNPMSSGYEVFTKSAACDEALEYASHIQSSPDKRVILTISFGEYEHWGPNKKGDAFPHNGIHGLYPTDVPRDFFKPYQARIPKEFGISTFATVFDKNGVQIGGGNTFWEHKNKVPPELMGKPYNPNNPNDPRCGYIQKAFFNPKMRRVEVIHEVWQHKLPEIVWEIDNGKIPTVSMACKIPFDRCIHCNNLASKKEDYCIHLNNTRYRRGSLDSNYVPIGMLNEFCVYFDNTVTRNRAAREALGLVKVASEEPEVEETKRVVFTVPEKNLDHKEASLIQIIQKKRLVEPSLPPQAIVQLKRFPLIDIFRGMSTMGMYPTGNDIGNLINDDYCSVRPEGMLAEGLLPRVVSGELNPGIPKLKQMSITLSDPDPGVISKIMSIVSDSISEKGGTKTASVVNLQHYPSNPDKETISKALNILAIRSHLDPQVIKDLQSLISNPHVLQLLLESGISVPSLRDLPVYNMPDKKQLISQAKIDFIYGE